MQVINEVINVFCPARTIFVVISMLKNIAGNQGNSAPYRAILVFINQDVQKPAGVEFVVD